MHRLYYERVVKPVARRSKHVITVSATSANSIRTWLDDDGINVHDCGNGCSEAFTLEGPVYETQTPYFLFVGNLKPHKRPRLAMEILKNVPEVDLKMVVRDGDGARAMAESLGVDDRVTIHSGLTDDELASLYRGSLALLFTSEWEGFGLPIVESIRCGTPVICDSSCDSAAELAGHDPSSLVMPTGSSAKDWADGARLVLSELRRADASDAWLASHSWPAVAARVDDVLTQVG
jgi:glycosyltransferase involved in cell wall biosynthesis